MKTPRQYNPPAQFSNVLDVIEYLRQTKGIRPSDGFAMVAVYVDGEMLKFKSHAAAINCFMTIRSGAYTKAFRNYSDGLTLQVGI